MTNPIAIGFGLFLLSLIALDISVFDGANIVFLGKELMDLINWLAFWR